MEEEAERMAALKRAYADIILNTAKESAARVLAAERRALGFQQRLFAAKEEALSTMLRLKALMEEKIREAEKAAVCQARKIEELELQLGEAEDTIVDLREDLKRVREELLIIKNGSVQPSSEGNINDTSILSNNIGKETITDISNEPGNMPVAICNNMSTLSQKTTDTHQCCLQNVKKAEYSEGVSEMDCPGNADLASIIWTKVPELYRKGYTQRIHALEHNFTSKGPFGDRNGLQASSKSELLTSSSEKLRNFCKTKSVMLDKRTTGLDEDVSMFEETDQQPGYCETVEAGQEPGCSGKDHFKFSSGFSPGMRRTIYNQSNGTFSGKSKSCSSSSKFMVHDIWNGNEALKATPDPSIQVESEVDDATNDKMSLADISAERESMMMNHCRLDTFIKTENMGIKQCTEVINCRSFLKQNQFVCEDKFLQNSSRISEDVKDLEAIQDDVEDMTEGVVASKAEVENITENYDNCNTEKSDSKDTANGTAQSGEDKFLKYTFQRKRKKGSSPVKNEIVFPEKKSTLKPRSVDRQNAVPVPAKSSVPTDLPRNNRRLVQVARQLISLSEKRW